MKQCESKFEFYYGTACKMLTKLQRRLLDMNLFRYNFYISKIEKLIFMLLC